LTSLTTFREIVKCVSKPKSAAVNNIDEISISFVFRCHKYRYSIDIGIGGIDSSLLGSAPRDRLFAILWYLFVDVYISSIRSVLGGINYIEIFCA